MSLVALIEAKPRDPATGAVSTLRLVCNARERANYFNAQWLPSLLTLPASETALGFDGNNFGQGASPTVSEIAFYVPGVMAAWASKLWRSAEVKLQVAAWPVGGGDPADGAFVQEFAGLADTLSVDASGLARVTILDPGQKLRAPVTTRTFGQTGDALLDSADAVRANKGQAVPLGWGELLKKPGRVVNQANLIYLFAGNAATSVQGFFDGGLPFTLGVARASLAALQANVPAKGAVDYCLSAGGLFLARPWSAPVYPFTADFTSGSTKPADIAAAIVASRTALTFKAGVVAAFNALEDGPAQFYVADTDSTLAAALDQIFAGLGAWWKLTAAGTIDIRRWAFAAPVKTFASWQVASIERAALIMPTAKRTLRFAQIGLVHSDGDIARTLIVTQGSDIGIDNNATAGDNLVYNSSLAQDLDGWEGSATVIRVAGAAGDPVPGYIQFGPVAVDFTSRSNRRADLPNTADIWYSGVTYKTAGTTGSLFLFLIWYRADSSQIGAHQVDISPAVAATWTPFSDRVTRPADAVYMVVQLARTAGAGIYNAGAMRVAATQPGADVTAQNAPSIEVPPTVTIKADSAGVVLSGQLPRDVQGIRRKGTIDVSASTTWSATAIVGSAGSIDADGTVNLTACASNGRIAWETSRDGVVLKAETSIVKQNADPPATTGGGGGTGGGSSGSGSAAYDTTIGPTNRTSYASANGGPLSVVVGSSGTVNLTAPLEYTSTGTSIAARGKWQWRISGGTFADVAAEIGEVQTYIASEFQPGYIEVNQSKGGLTPGSTYEFQLLLRKVAGSGQINFTGTATATPT